MQLHNSFIRDTLTMSQTKIMNLTEKEYQTLQEMLEFYKEFQQNLYDNHDEPERLFTSTQRSLFEFFDLM